MISHRRKRLLCLFPVSCWPVIRLPFLPDRSVSPSAVAGEFRLHDLGSVLPLGSPVRLSGLLLMDPDRIFSPSLGVCCLSWSQILQSDLPGLSLRLWQSVSCCPAADALSSALWPVVLLSVCFLRLRSIERRFQPVQMKNCPSDRPTHALRAKFTLPDSPSPDLPVRFCRRSCLFCSMI